MGLLLNFKKLFEVINIAQKENKHQPYDLAQMQSLPLSAKILMSQQRIRDWYEHWDGQVYISFSGGKDSTVLLDLVRKIYPDVPAVFCDTGLEYPEVRAFVKTFDNVDWIHPEKYNRKTKIWERYAFPQVIQDVGYTVPSKEQAAFIQEYRDTSSEKLKNIRLNGNVYGREKISSGL